MKSKRLPKPDRPNMPDYGILDASSGSGLMSWSRLSDQMSKARNYWIITTRPNGRPHATPVWGVWLDEVFYFGMGARSRKARNIESNPWIVVHLESGDDVVILEGTVERITDQTTLAHIDEVYAAKYNFHPLGDETKQLDNPFYALHPHKAYSWLEKDFPGSATRWQF
jgi:general stress protein 26